MHDMSLKRQETQRIYPKNVAAGRFQEALEVAGILRI